MIQLPRWVLTNEMPAFYESESATSIEMVAKLYGAMQTLIDEYNSFAEGMEKTINDFMADATTDREVFEVAMRQEFQDFIDVVELKVTQAENYMKSNLRETAESYLNEVIDEFNTQILNFNETKAAFENRFELFLADSEREFANQNASITQQNVTLGNTIKAMETRLAQQDVVIGDAVSYMSTNLNQSLSAAIDEALNNGDIVVTTVYNEETENLDFVVTGGETV